jgi:hypothetical protein
MENKKRIDPSRSLCPEEQHRLSDSQIAHQISLEAIYIHKRISI